jgi:hypothetical protein
METPQNNIWGPHLWIILHSLAERIKGNSSEENRLWTGLLSSLRYSLPCPQCKKHYSDYYTANQVSSITDIRIWLYNLHSQVNNRLDKPNSAIEQLSEYSKPFHFTRHYSFLYTHMLYALRLGWCTHVDSKRTIRFLNEIKYYYDLF